MPSRRPLLDVHSRPRLGHSHAVELLVYRLNALQVRQQLPDEGTVGQGEDLRVLNDAVRVSRPYATSSMPSLQNIPA